MERTDRHRAFFARNLPETNFVHTSVRDEKVSERTAPCFKFSTNSKEQQQQQTQQQIVRVERKSQE